jgi:lipoprotein-releasing system permease protein
LRYTRSKRRNSFISFISLTSIIGMALGVMVLITVLSVMNGFDHTIRQRVFQMAPQVTVKSMDDHMRHWQQVAQKLHSYPQVKALAPFVMGQGMLAHDGEVHPVILQGINVKAQERMNQLDQKVTAGRLKDLKAGQFGIVLGTKLANNLLLNVGDKVTVVTPKASLTPVGVIPRFKRFTVVAIFSGGEGFGFDSQMAFIQLQDGQQLFQKGNTVTGIHLQIKDLYQAPQLTQTLNRELGGSLFASDWTQRFGPLFEAISMEKHMMFLILLLIIAVAAFNLVSTLVMVVADKQADIAILRTFGATPKTIMAIFIVQGLFIGLIGTLLGVVGGVALSLNVTQVVNVIQNVFHVQLLSSSVYFVDYLPSLLKLTDIIEVTSAALGLTLLATLYPAWRAARTQPAEALRYE